MTYDTYLGTLGPAAPAIYLIDSPEHPTALGTAAPSLACTVVRVPIDRWGERLTPWPAAALYRGEQDYVGRADETRAWLTHEVIPAAEEDAGLAPGARGVAGYSLAGLFALHTFVHDARFDAVACLSGSLWYEGWLEHLDACAFDGKGRYAYLSLGSKERRAARPALKAVEDRTRATVERLRARGVETDFVLNPGGHLTHIGERTVAGLCALDAFLAGGAA